MTFDDLKFKPHAIERDGSIQALATFENGYGVSVIQGELFYTSNAEEYELAIIGKDGLINYTTGLTEDVFGHLTREEVTDIMKKVQAL